MSKKSLLLILLFLLIGFSLIYLSNQQAGQDVDKQENRVKLYFATKDAMYLQSEERIIEGEDSLIYEETIKQLINGPQSSKLTGTIPQGVKLLNIKIEDKIAYLSFNQALVDNHWGGSTGEVMTVYSIVNTMTEFPEINSVKILIEGEEIETLAGHLGLTTAIDRDEKIIKE